jgi:hypothetical protein
MRFGTVILTGDGTVILTGDGTVILTGVGTVILTGDGTVILTGDSTVILTGDGTVILTGEKLKYPDKDLSKCQFDHHNSHIDLPGIESGTTQLEAGD